MDKNNIKEFFRKSSTYPLNWVPESDSFFLGRKAVAIGRALHQDIVAELSSVATGSIVLDAGVGKGRLVTDILSKKPKLLVCVDLSKYMLSICKDSTKNKGKENIEFILCDVMKLPFRNDIFDLSVRIGVLMHLESAQDALLEFSRILKTRGLLISDNVNNSLIGHIYVVGFNFTRALIHGGVFKVLEKYLKTRRVGSRISTSYSLKEQQDLHQKANLTIIKMKEYGNKYFPWIFLTLSRRRSLQFSQMFFNY